MDKPRILIELEKDKGTINIAGVHGELLAIIADAMMRNQMFFKIMAEAVQLKKEYEEYNNKTKG